MVIEVNMNTVIQLNIAWVRTPAGVCEKVATGMGLGGSFRRVLYFLLYLKLASLQFAYSWRK